ncbi:hypothetical protein JCM11641_004068 [Rhodosporidiobolus odoratus]
MSALLSPILIVGATGKQGGSVVRALQKLPNPPAIRALSRNPASPAAEKLKAQGIEVVKGSLTDAASLRAALKGAASAFLVTNVTGKGEIPEDEQGKAFLSAALETSLPYLIFTSVSDATPTCGVPHFETKAKVEQAIKESGIKHTILAPVAFYDNFPRKSGLATFAGMGLFEAALQGKELKMVACDDIGYIAAQALTNPNRYSGRHIPLAGDSLTMSQVRSTYAKVQNTSVSKAWFPSWIVNILPHDFNRMLLMFREKGFVQADPEGLRREFPQVRTFEQWLREGSE